jgi:hypothetical protein
MARVEEELAAKHPPLFLLRSIKQEVEITSLDKNGAMRVASAGVQAPYKWASLTYEDKANLARAMLRKDNPADLCLAAFYLLASGAEGAADELLQKVPDEKDVTSVLAAFR